MPCGYDTTLIKMIFRIFKKHVSFKKKKIPNFNDKVDKILIYKNTHETLLN